MLGRGSQERYYLSTGGYSIYNGTACGRQGTLNRHLHTLLYRRGATPPILHYSFMFSKASRKTTGIVQVPEHNRPKDSPTGCAMLS